MEFLFRCGCTLSGFWRRWLDGWIGVLEKVAGNVRIHGERGLERVAEVAEQVAAKEVA